MSPLPLSALINAAWDEVLRTSENPLTITGASGLGQMLGLPRLTYREHLDRVRINHYGDVIPRMAIVRQNIAKLSAFGPRKTPRLPV